MEILWLAILFYSVGLATVLHFRPALMFNANGTWKEFGYHRAASARYTLFPVWLFAIVWAIVSYTLAATVVWTWRSAPVVAAAVPAYFASRQMDVAVEDGDYGDEMEEEDMVPVSAAPAMTETIRMRPESRRIQTPARQPRMGYYVLDPASEKSGLRRYIYYGNAPPPEVSVNQNKPLTTVL